ncbi:hypothetical protein BOTCAL_0592g00030 [Botryotinia calthae]|uniref:Uncharacterized protein n=1 Tax=Botryotinia calthae TaxID=38488 RepID=A0A4Y8CJ05_9HELO|nr:hypothetical protein BOTCAL_0592g00030 [Botryotinia calthae]
MKTIPLITNHKRDPLNQPTNSPAYLNPISHTANNEVCLIITPRPDPGLNSGLGPGFSPGPNHLSSPR